MIGLTYKDVVHMVDQAYDGYGDIAVGSEADVGALFNQSTSQNHSYGTIATTSDANAYLDPENAFVIANANRLEGMLVMSNAFGAPEAESWYKIVTARIGQSKLLDNQIDNIHIFLNKTRDLSNVIYNR